MKNLYMILPLTLILCFMVSCEHRKSLVDLGKFQAQAKVEEQNKAVVLQFFEEFDKGNLDSVFELFAPDILWHMGGFPEPWTLQDLKKRWPPFFEAFPDFNHTKVHLIAEGDKVAARSIDSATHKGEFMGISPTGNKIEYLAIGILTIKDGKIKEVWVVDDMLTFMQQLGLELKPKVGE